MLTGDETMEPNFQQTKSTSREQVYTHFQDPNFFLTVTKSTSGAHRTTQVPDF